MDDGLAEPDAEGVVGRAFVAPGAHRRARRAVGGGVLAGGRRLPLRRSRVVLSGNVAVWGRAAEQFIPIQVGAICGGFRTVRAEVVHEPSEAKELDREGAEHHEEERQAKPPVVVLEVVVDREPHITAHIGHIHGHGGYDPQAVPHRVFLLLPAQAKARRVWASTAAAPRLSVSEVRVPGARRVGLRSRVEPLHRPGVLWVLQWGEGHIALLHFQDPVRFGRHY